MTQYDSYVQVPYLYLHHIYIRYLSCTMCINSWRNSYQFSPRIRRDSKKLTKFEENRFWWTSMVLDCLGWSWSLGRLWLSVSDLPLPLWVPSSSSAASSLCLGDGVASMSPYVAMFWWNHHMFEWFWDFGIWRFFHRTVMISGVLSNFMNVKRGRDVKRKKNLSNRFRWRRQRRSICEYIYIYIYIYTYICIYIYVYIYMYV